MKKLNFLTLVFVILLLVLTSCNDSVDPPKTNLLDKSSIKYFGTSHSAQSLKFYANTNALGPNTSTLVELDLEHNKIYKYDVIDATYAYSILCDIKVDSNNVMSLPIGDGNYLIVYDATGAEITQLEK